MSFAALVEAMGASAVDTLAGFDRAAAIEAGFKPSDAKAWAALHAVYYGPTRATRYQKALREKARASKFSLHQLALIEQHLARVSDKKQQRELRMELLSVRGSYDTLNRRAKEIVPTAATPPKDSFRVTASKMGKRSVHITADERFVADLEHAIHQYAKAIAATKSLDAPHVTRPTSTQMLTAFVAFMRGGLSPAGDGDGAGIPLAAPRPLLLIPLPEWTKIIRGDRDDVELSLTDGTTITGADFLNQYYANPEFGLEAATFHPTEGPVNLYRAGRYANDKQRDLARATTPVCPVPGCKVPADYCQVHHITAWKNGGETNMDNLTMLCSYHNAINDDGPHPSADHSAAQGSTRGTARGGARPRNAGTMIRLRGTPMWRSPKGYAVPNPHPHYASGAMISLFGDPRRRNRTKATSKGPP